MKKTWQPCQIQSAPGKRGETETQACTVICGRSTDRAGKRHQRSPIPAPLEPCEPFVSSSCHRQLPREALGYEVSVFSCGKAPGFSRAENQTKEIRNRQKGKSRPCRACKGSAWKRRIGLVGKRNFPPLKEQVWKGLRVANITRTLTSKRKVRYYSRLKGVGR